MSIRSSSIFCIAYIKHQTSNLKLQIQDSELETGFFVRVVQFGALPVAVHDGVNDTDLFFFVFKEDVVGDVEFPDRRDIVHLVKTHDPFFFLFITDVLKRNRFAIGLHLQMLCNIGGYQFFHGRPVFGADQVYKSIVVLLPQCFFKIIREDLATDLERFVFGVVFDLGNTYINRVMCA